MSNKLYVLGKHTLLQLLFRARAPAPLQRTKHQRMRHSLEWVVEESTRVKQDLIGHHAMKPCHVENFLPRRRCPPYLGFCLLAGALIVDRHGYSQH